MISIFTKFLNLKSEKQEAILNAALKEFAKKGFENASTNEIVKNAGISKGLLFHYFHNKKDLFLFLYDYSIEILMKEFFGKLDLSEKDIFIRLRWLALLKAEIIKKHPEMFNFLFAANIENSSDIKNDLEKRNKKLFLESYYKLFEGIEIDKFKEGIDIKKAINIIIWVMEGFSSQEQKRAKLHSLDQFDFEKASVEFDIYLDVLKECFYR